MNALTMTVPRRREKAVNTAALAALITRVKNACTLRNLLRALFCKNVSLTVGGIVVAAMWWHNLSIDNVEQAQAAVGYDCLCGMPWAIVWTIRATLSDLKTSKEGGEV